MDNVLGAADLRAEIARRRVFLYDMAPRLGMHPARLGALLNGRGLLGPDLARRILRAIDEVQPREERRSR